MSPDKKSKYLGLRLTEKEYEIVKKVQATQNFRYMTEAISHLLRFAGVYFEERVTIALGVKPSALDMMLDSAKYRQITPLCDIVRNVPELENLLAKDLQESS